MTLALRYGGTHAKVDSRAKDSALLKKPAAALPCIASLVLRDKSWISARVLRLHTL